MSSSKIHSFIKQVRSLSLLSLLFFFAACEKNVENIKLPTSDPKLVVGCFISPQDASIIVTLTRSNPIFGSGHTNMNSQPVADASVIISNSTNSISVPYNSGDEQYELSASLFPIVAGQTYSLTVSTPKGENASASCTVPSSNLNAMSVEFTDTTSSPKKITVRWQDIYNETNYYRVVGQMVSIDSLQVNDTIFDNMYGNTTLYNDHNKDGNEMYSKLEGYPYISFENNVKLTGYDIYILNISPEYYNYQNSLDHYTYNDPFSEPSPLYTNIKGGLGIFAAYQSFHMRFP